MREKLLMLWNSIKGNFGKPETTVSVSEDKLKEIDSDINDILTENEKAAARIRLLEIKSTPRGYRR